MYLMLQVERNRNKTLLRLKNLRHKLKKDSFQLLDMAMEEKDNQTKGYQNYIMKLQVKVSGEK